MSDAEPDQHHHSLRERLDAAEAAAEEVVAEESGEQGSLAISVEELTAAVHMAIHPDELGERDGRGQPVHGGDPPADRAPTADEAQPAP